MASPLRLGFGSYKDPCVVGRLLSLLVLEVEVQAKLILSRFVSDFQENHNSMNIA